MSAPTQYDQPAPVPRRGGAGAKLLKAVAAVATVVALVFGANAITRGESPSAGSSGSQSAQTAPTGRPGAGMPPQMGTAVTGTTLTRLRAAVTAKYPGTVERAVKLADGSYVVHVVRSSGEVHVLVSKDFKVTGVDQGGPPGGAPPAGSTAPSAATSTTES